LHRLEGKGLLDSSLGGATDRRGGRRKRMYHVTKVGYRSLEVMKEQRITLWKMVPRLKFNP
ncbi:MAG: PadR family transcriptional regulator, partial [Cyclobacteriaceae bacterium]